MAYANLEGLGWLAEDMQAWTAAHYEPKIVFDDTPVYSVTLAEDVDISDSVHYIIDLEQSYREIWIYVQLTAALTVNLSVLFVTPDGASLRGAIMTTGANATCFSTRNANARYTYGFGGVLSNKKTVYTMQIPPVFFDGDYNRVEIFYPSASQIPAGTIISIYAAKEV